MPANNVQSAPLTITQITDSSISFKWNRAPGCTVNPDPIRYQVWLTLMNDPTDPWHRVKEGTGFYEHTFTGLKRDTEYAFRVEAHDASGCICQYPIANGCMTAKTRSGADKTAPTVSSRAFKVTRITSRSFAASWTPARDDVTEAKDILYKVFLTMAEDPTDPWRQVGEGKGITSFTFSGLKSNTMYAFYVKAFDKAGNSLQYPVDNGCMTARTNRADTQAPTVDVRAISVLQASKGKLILQWNRASDNLTAASDIKYEVYLKESGNIAQDWKVVKEGQDITRCTITGLKDGVRYAFFIKAYDEDGNVLKYPMDNGCATVLMESDGPRLVYYMQDSFYCNGEYGGSSGQNTLKVNLGSGFNRNYFEINLDFYALKTDKDGEKYDTIFTLDSSRRAMGLVMKDGALQVTLQNGTKGLDPKQWFTAKKWQHLMITYDNGYINFNGSRFKIGELVAPGNNILSSTNPSNGHAFKGYFKDIVIRTK